MCGEADEAPADAAAEPDTDVLYTSAAVMIAAVADGIASKLRVSAAVGAPQQCTLETPPVSSVRVTLEAAGELQGGAEVLLSTTDADASKEVASAGADRMLRMSPGTAEVEADSAAGAEVEEQPAPLPLFGEHAQPHALYRSSEAGVMMLAVREAPPLLVACNNPQQRSEDLSSHAEVPQPAPHEVPAPQHLSAPDQPVPVCPDVQGDSAAATAGGTAGQSAEALQIGGECCAPAMPVYGELLAPTAAGDEAEIHDACEGGDRLAVTAVAADVLEGESATMVVLVTDASTAAETLQLCDEGEMPSSDGAVECTGEACGPPLHEVPVGNPQPTPAKRMPVSPSGAQQPATEAMGSTQASLPPVPRDGATADGMMRPLVESSPAMHEQRSQTAEEAMPADSLELNTVATRVYTGQLVTDRLEPASEPVKQPACAVNTSDSSVGRGVGLLSHRDQTSIVAADVGAAKQVDGAEVPTTDSRRASMIMMDAAHTPEVAKSGRPFVRPWIQLLESQLGVSMHRRSLSDLRCHSHSKACNTS